MYIAQGWVVDVMIAGDVIQIVDRQLLQAQRMLNVYFYSVGAVVGDPSLQAVSDQFVTDVVTPVKALQHSSLTHDGIQIDNLSSAVEFGLFPITEVGGLAGNVMPVFTAIAVKLLRTTKITRNGSKRFAGINEESIIGGLLSISAPTEAALEAAMSIILLVVDGGSTVDLTPVIVGRDPLGGLDLLKLNVIADGDVQGVSTQNSRKLGRGI